MWLKNDYLNAVLSKFFIILCSFLNTVVINRYLGLEMRGEFAYYLNVVNIMSVFISFAISSSLPFLREKYGDKSIYVILRIINIQMLIYFSLVVFSSFFIILENYIYILLTSLILQYANQLDFIVMIIDIKKRNVLISVSIFIYFSILVISYLFFKSSLDIIIFSFMLYAIVRIIFYILSLREFFTIKIKKAKHIKFIEIIKISGLSMLVALLGMLNYNADVIILQRYVSFSEIGIYSAAVGLASMFWVVPDAFKEVILGRLDGENGLRNIISAIKINIIFSLVVFIFFFFIGREFIVFVYGDKYEPSFTIVLMLLAGVIPMIFFKLISAYYLYMGRQTMTLLASIAALLLNVTMNFYLVPRFGIDGSAIAAIASYFFVGASLTFVFIYDNPKSVRLFMENSKKEIMLFFS